MWLIHSNRACQILYDFLVANSIRDKVLLPANICADVVETITRAGAVPCFIDIDLTTLCMKEQDVLKRAVDAKVLLFVHTYGVESNFEDFFQKVKEINPQIVIVDDKCLCWPDLSVNVITNADLVLYSTGAKKQLDLGRGGYGLIKGQWTEIMNCGNVSVGENEGLKNTDIQCVNNHRRTLYNIYREKLPLSIQLPEQFQKWRFNIIINNKETILKALFAEGLFASGHYKPHSVDCPNAIWLYNHVVNLFEDRYYTDELAERTCEVINSYLQ